MTQPYPDQPPDPGGPRLSDADMRVLDFLAEHGFDASRVNLLPEADRPRAMALIRQMQVLDHYPADGADDSLVDATLARIDRWEAANEEARRFHPRRTTAFRLSDLIGIAAVLMVGTAVLVPVARSLRENGLASGCRANMRTVGTALANYASQHDGLLPATASIADFGSFLGSRRAAAPTANGRVPGEAGPVATRMQPVGAPLTLDVRTPGSWTRLRVQFVQWHALEHSSNLEPLVAGQYCPAGAMACPACASGSPCFAYQVPRRGERFILDRGFRSVVVADANPVTEANRLGLRVSHLQSSNNHGQKGQNMLFSDGSVEWHTSPLLPGDTEEADNIWLPRDTAGRERIDLRAWPTHARDTFVTQ